jgi:hypothetical protein
MGKQLQTLLTTICLMYQEKTYQKSIPSIQSVRDIYKLLLLLAQVIPGAFHKTLLRSAQQWPRQLFLPSSIHLFLAKTLRATNNSGILPSLLFDQTTLGTYHQPLRQTMLQLLRATKSLRTSNRLDKDHLRRRVCPLTQQPVKESAQLRLNHNNHRLGQCKTPTYPSHLQWKLPAI